MVWAGVSVRNGPFHVFVFLFSTFRSLPLDFAKVSVLDMALLVVSVS